MRYKILIMAILLFYFNNYVYSQPIGTEVCYSYEEMKLELQKLVNLYPDIAMLQDIGDSRGKEYYSQGFLNYEPYNHDIWAVKVSDNVTIEEDEPSIYFMGLQRTNFF